MDNTFLFRTDALILCIILFVLCILMVLFGSFFRKKFIREDGEESKGDVGTLIGALFGLWGFVLAFTFGASANRFENIRLLMVEEGNSLRTAILRTQAFPDSIGNPIRKDLRAYLEIRIHTYEGVTDLNSLMKARKNAEDVGKEVWVKTIHASDQPNLAFSGANMLAALTNLYDISARKDAVLLSGVPDLIIWILFFIALVISFTGGFTIRHVGTKEWIVVAGFILLAVVVIYLTMDLGRPLRGFIKPDVGQERLTRLREFF